MGTQNFYIREFFNILFSQIGQSVVLNKELKYWKFEKNEKLKLVQITKNSDELDDFWTFCVQHSNFCVTLSNLDIWFLVAWNKKNIDKLQGWRIIKNAHWEIDDQTCATYIILGSCPTNVMDIAFDACIHGEDDHSSGTCEPNEDHAARDIQKDRAMKRRTFWYFWNFHHFYQVLKTVACP